jgi:hypothetical protein
VKKVRGFDGFFGNKSMINVGAFIEASQYILVEIGNSFFQTLGISSLEYKLLGIASIGCLLLEHLACLLIKI